MKIRSQPESCLRPFLGRVIEKIQCDAKQRMVLYKVILIATTGVFVFFWISCHLTCNVLYIRITYRNMNILWCLSGPNRGQSGGNALFILLTNRLINPPLTKETSNLRPIDYVHVWDGLALLWIWYQVFMDACDMSTLVLQGIMCTLTRWWFAHAVATKGEI